MKNLQQFTETKKRYKASMPEVVFPIAYSDWMQLPKEMKAPALFVSFFDTITFAVLKFQSVAISEEDIISAINYNLVVRIVPTIEGHPKKYTNAYIRKSINNTILDYERIQSDKDHRDNDVSNIQYNENNQEIDLFEMLYNNDTNDDFKEHALDNVYRLITGRTDNLDGDIRAVVNAIIKSKKIPKNVKSKLPVIYKLLRKALAEPASYFSDIHLDCKTFEDVINCEDLIDSAVVLMCDGTKAVYLGEKIIKRIGVIDYVFMGATRDYIVPNTVARGLTVVSVEAID